MSKAIPSKIAHCPRCHADGDERPCGCVEYECGAVLTCDDYHHGDGILLDPCPTTTSETPT